MRHFRWHAFPQDTSAFDYSATLLKRHWTRLHGGDLEKFPSLQTIARRLKGKSVGDKKLVIQLTDAWRAFHSGALQTAFDAGIELGLAGIAVASKAVGVYAHGVEPSAERARKLLEEALRHTEAAIEELPDDANIHYFHAFILGRLSQRISVVSAIAAGYAPKLRHSLERALELEPRHADAHLAMGLYHAEIIAKLGGLAASLTYGVDRDVSQEHLERAVAINGRSPTTLTECAYGWELLWGDAKRAQIAKLYRRAAAAVPMDAMECLDVEKAKRLLEATA